MSKVQQPDIPNFILKVNCITAGLQLIDKGDSVRLSNLSPSWSTSSDESDSIIKVTLYGKIDG
jgi:hypothetical protein